ncbi:MAG: guanylate kinase [Bacteroidota bacterium]|nr:guanylate kinase [Bacteroidota bacterium]
MKGKKVLILCGPSGAGKTSLAKEVLTSISSFSFSVSATTRKPRSHELNGRDYYFLDLEEFKSILAKGGLIESEEVYENVWYGTLSSEVDRIWASNNYPLLDIDVYGAMNIKEKYLGQAIVIFIHPGTVDNIKERLSKRATEDIQSYNMRIAKAEEELKFADQCDFIIYNETLAEAKTELFDIIEQNFIEE